MGSPWNNTESKKGMKRTINRSNGIFFLSIVHYFFYDRHLFFESITFNYQF